MAEHEPQIGASDEWYTPPEIFSALDVIFDLDPCSPQGGSHVPTKDYLTKSDDGLSHNWYGFVWMNPPFGGRNGHIPWLKKFLQHGDGIALVRAYTSAGWFHDYAVKADCMVFPRGKTKFIREDGSIGKSPGSGIVLLGVGETAVNALRNCKLGLFVLT